MLTYGTASPPFFLKGMENAMGCCSRDFSSSLSSETCRPPLLRCFLDDQESPVCVPACGTAMPLVPVFIPAWSWFAACLVFCFSLWERQLLNEISSIFCFFFLIRSDLVLLLLSCEVQVKLFHSFIPLCLH